MKFKTKAIIFDMVGPLLQKDPEYKKDKIVEEVELLASKYKDTEQFKHQLKINNITNKFLEKEISKRVVKKYIKIDKIWGELLPILKKHKYKLAIINNGMSLTVPLFKKQNEFKKFFSVFINSFEEKIEKPDPRIYILTCKKLRVKPEECIFIDDLEKNVIGAKKVGMLGLTYKNYELLKSQLLDILGIKI